MKIISGIFRKFISFYLDFLRGMIKKEFLRTELGRRPSRPVALPPSLPCGSRTRRSPSRRLVPRHPPQVGHRPLLISRHPSTLSPSSAAAGPRSSTPPPPQAPPPAAPLATPLIAAFPRIACGATLPAAAVAHCASHRSPIFWR